jgi:hypothetical protein
MTRKIYDAGRAEALIPLLRSITDEIQEREEAIDRGSARLQVGKSLSAPERQRLEAELSVHKRELRFALQELERLGCALDLDHPLRVLIPGSTTKLGPRFEWSPEDTKIQAR